MHIGILGPLLVQRDGRAVTPSGQRPRDVLAVLLQRRGQYVPPEVILDLVWAQQAASLSVAAVHTVVARLRRGLGPDAVETHETGYRLSPAATTDAEAFGEQVRRARDVAAGRGREQAIGLFREAIGLWRSPTAYEGVSDELVLAERARLDELRSTAVEDLAAALLDQHTVGSAEEALELCTGLARRHPLRERPHGLAMVAAYRCGRQAEALEIYRSLRRRLRAELGIDPSPALAAVHAQVLAQDSALDGSAPPAPAVRGRPVLRARCVPVPANPTVGREADIAAVVDAVNAGRRLITVVGPGGVGKSRVLAEVAAALAGTREVGYLDLSGLSGLDMDGLAEAAALAFGHAVPADDAVAGLVSILTPLSLVMLVDEAEWVLDAVAGVLRRVLDACPGVSFVVTSRVPLEIVGERRAVLEPLSCPPAGADVDTVTRSAAVQLLTDRLLDQVPDLAPDDAELQLLARIARRLDGLPLALELVAGHAATRTLDELADLIESPLDVAAGDRDRAPRHRSLRETLRWSVDRLDPAHQRALRRLGVFAGAFDLAAAVAVIGRLPGPLPGSRGAAGLDVEAVVRRLVRDAHIAVDRRGPVLRLRLLRTVRDLALDELTAHDEWDAVRRRHREWFAARWRGVPLQDDLIEDVRAGYEDYLEALRSALEARDGAITADLMATLGRLWLFTEAFGPGLRWTTLALDSGLLAPACRAKVLVTHAALLQQSAGPSVGELVEEAVQELALAGDDVGLAEALALWVVEQYLNGELEEAARTAARLIDLARDAAPQHLPEALSSFAVTQAALGRLEEANAAAQEAWELVTAAPSATYFVAVVSKIALAHTESGQARRALEVLEDAMADSGRILGIEPTDTMVINAGWAALGCDRPETALPYFSRAFRDAPRSSVTIGMAEALLGAACAAATLGDGRAGAALASSEVLVAELGVAISPWQREQVAVARARLATPRPADPSPGASPRARAEAIRALLSTAVR